MLINEILLSQVPVLKRDDTIAEALIAFEDCKLTQLPIIENDKLIGIIDEEVIAVANQALNVETLLTDLIPIYIYPEQHLLEALKKISIYNADLIPVIHQDTKEYMGSLLSSQLIKSVGTYVSASSTGAVVVIEVNPYQYSFGELCRLIETNDAFITQLNTYTNTSTGMMTVSIKVNKNEVSDIVATLQRYEYQVKAYFGDEYYANELRENYDHLMNYLEI